MSIRRTGGSSWTCLARSGKCAGWASAPPTFLAITSKAGPRARICGSNSEGNPNMASENTTAERIPAATAERRKSGGMGLYLSLVAVQTAGAAILLVNGVPVYRQITSDFAHHEPPPGVLWYAVAAVAL